MELGLSVSFELFNRETGCFWSHKEERALRSSQNILRLSTLNLAISIHWQQGSPWKRQVKMCFTRAKDPWGISGDHEEQPLISEAFRLWCISRHLLSTLHNNLHKRLSPRILTDQIPTFLTYSSCQVKCWVNSNTGLLQSGVEKMSYLRADRRRWSDLHHDNSENVSLPRRKKKF